jgi:hypothetical protein
MEEGPLTMFAGNTESWDGAFPIEQVREAP